MGVGKFLYVWRSGGSPTDFRRHAHLMQRTPVAIIPWPPGYVKMHHSAILDPHSWMAGASPEAETGPQVGQVDPADAQWHYAVQRQVVCQVDSGFEAQFGNQ
ncbi:MAG: hypothetical protein HZY76_14945 [Anaerolineae bacterium]|nr:MAG: hypothetical protein HZY76_14945 [Anaerolineae bacterium]